MTTESPIRTYRRLHGLTAKALAEKLKISDVTLRSYENGHRRIPAEFAVEFETITGVPRETLLPDLFRRSAA
jgi:transcriptional regulator with XRE-family HTH domain